MVRPPSKLTGKSYDCPKIVLPFAFHCFCLVKGDTEWSARKRIHRDISSGILMTYRNDCERPWEKDREVAASEIHLLSGPVLENISGLYAVSSPTAQHLSMILGRSGSRYFCFFQFRYNRSSGRRDPVSHWQCRFCCYRGSHHSSPRTWTLHSFNLITRKCPTTSDDSTGVWAQPQNIWSPLRVIWRWGLWGCVSRGMPFTTWFRMFTSYDKVYKVQAHSRFWASILNVELISSLHIYLHQHGSQSD